MTGQSHWLLALISPRSSKSLLLHWIQEQGLWRKMWTMNHSLEPDVSQSLKRQGDHHGVYRRSTGNEVKACTSDKGMTQLNMGPLVISHALYFLVVSRE